MASYETSSIDTQGIWLTSFVLAKNIYMHLLRIPGILRAPELTEYCLQQVKRWKAHRPHSLETDPQK